MSLKESLNVVCDILESHWQLSMEKIGLVRYTTSNVGCQVNLIKQWFPWKIVADEVAVVEVDIHWLVDNVSLYLWFCYVDKLFPVVLAIQE